MGQVSFRLRRVLFLVALIGLASTATTSLAQTIVLNPRTVQFVPSADQDAVLPDGRPVVSSYSLNVYMVGAAQPFQTQSLGKPSPGADGLIHYDFSSTVASWPLPGGNYEARVAAIGPTGSGVSDASNPFTFSSCTYSLSGSSVSLPSAGGGTAIGVNAPAGCAWTASSGVSWVQLTPTAGTGAGSVVATIAANTSTTARAGSVTVAGQPFTVNEAGATASTPPPASLPSPWTNQDVGAVGLAGSAAYASGTYTVTGAGADIWGTADGFQFVYQVLDGDGQIVARMTREQSTHTYAKAGVMIRASLDGSSAHVLLDATPSGGIEFMTRAAAGGTTSYVAGSTQTAPSWLKLARTGNTVTGYVSADGSSWRTVGSTTVTLGSSVSVGLVSCSHNTGATNTATFDNVSVTATLPVPWVAADIGTVGVAGSTKGAGGVFTVAGAGADIWGSADGFRFVYRTLAGDGQIVARMTGEQNTATYAKAGVMIRNALTAGAAHVLLDVVPGGGVEWLVRSATNATTNYLGGTTQSPPSWLRLVRTGNTITAAVSADGTTWRQVGSTTVTMNSSVYVGLAVTSHDLSRTNTATFDSVVVR